jgi:hypothetical protein
MSVEIKDHKDEFVEALNSAFMNALEKIGMVAESYAKAKCPVDTGFLRNSITHAIEGQGAAITEYTDNSGSQTGTYSGIAGGGSADIVKSVYIGTNVEYAVDVELGTGIYATGGGGSSGQKARPYLKPAATEHADHYKMVFLSELSK